MGDNLLQFRTSDDGIEYVENMMAQHGASRTEVLRAMLKVASQWPDRIADVLAGKPLGTDKDAALARMVDGF